jgi:hypothetical protein
MLDRGALDTSDDRDGVYGVEGVDDGALLATGGGGVVFATGTFFWHALKVTPKATTTIPANNRVFIETAPLS